MAGGVPAEDIQYEVFGPDLWLADFQQRQSAARRRAAESQQAVLRRAAAVS